MTTFKELIQLFKKLIHLYFKEELSALEVSYLLENTYQFILPNKYINIPNQFIEQFENLDIPYFSSYPENIDTKNGIFGEEEFRIRLSKFLESIKIYE